MNEVIGNVLWFSVIQYILFVAGIISAYIFIKGRRTMSFVKKVICIVLISIAGMLIIFTLFNGMFSTGSWGVLE